MAAITSKIKRAVADTIDRTAHLDVAKATQAIAKKFGLRERLVNYTHVEFRNKLNEYGYKSTPYNERILFLPHCMRNSKKCRAKQGEQGLECVRCGKCDLCELIKMSEDLGYKAAYITPGGSMVQKIVREQKPKAVMGICCYEEANIAFDKLTGTGIHAQASLLLYDGCKDTKANIADAREKMELIDRHLLQKTIK
ncbi:MAG: DUF116 domain-containing protein [Candidatus Diapherotrites archaeon]|uniref:DUF116 domain-containing protein n=1 Tax=Candidatus Iainarchaeum sp. TaxID=3101447 RepID=A0A938YMM9_9ARCH|nr:DUF116 domain-containing protein [Candidatus Diapherotrites archaeon]